ncbi:MAG TPA: cadherin-like beta sandwich domain-containing protein, partial [Gaiellaceae bacterium]|nr:cadherin-like beta sandwich domain-containing protein [Gaiellaceae bacterium]
VTVHGNSIAGGIANASSVGIDASRNWFGSLSGPGATTDVTTTPWCTASDCSTASDDADLTALSIPGASLSPAFASATTSYSVSLANSVTSVSLSQTAATGATATVHGSTSSLAVGTTTVTVQVTSLDGTATKTYTLAITRAGQPAGTTPATTTTTATTTATPPASPTVNAPASAPAAPGKSGSVAVAVAPATGASGSGGGTTAAPVTVAVTWAPQTFAEPVTVQVTPTTLTSIATLQPGGGSTTAQTVPLGGGFSLGSTVIQLNITTAAGAAVTSFAAPMVLHIDAGETTEVPAYSENGVTWTTIPRLGSPVLPDGQSDGYYVNADGSIDVYTRHATYYALVKDTQGPTAPTIKGRITAVSLRLSWRGMRDNVRVAGYTVLRNGRTYKTTKRTVVVLPRKVGRYVVFALDAAGNKGKRSHTVTVARTKDRRHPFKVSVS